MDVNTEVLSLWEEYYKKNSTISEAMELVPMFYHKSEHTPKKEIRVLSVGFNPSYVENNYKKDGVPKDLIEIHRWENFEKGNIDDILKIDMALRSEDERLKHLFYTRYFKPLNDFYHKIDILKNNDFQKSHFDLFFLRGTVQYNAQKLLIEKQIKIDNEGRKETKLTNFGEKQLQIFKKMLDSYDPSIIFVFNAGSSHIVCEKFLDYQPISDNGFFYYKKSDNEKIPVVLSTMLTNGRMDVFTRELLIWQINKYFNAA